MGTFKKSKLWGSGQKLVKYHCMCNPDIVYEGDVPSKIHARKSMSIEEARKEVIQACIDKKQGDQKIRLFACIDKFKYESPLRCITSSEKTSIYI